MTNAIFNLSTISVMDSDPTKSPSRDEIPLCQTSTTEDWNILAQLCNRNISFTTSLKYEVLINFICNYGQTILFSNFQDGLQVFFIKDRSARIGWVVDKDCNSVCINDRFHMFKINLPFLFRNQVVLLGIDSKAICQSRVQWKSRSWHQDILSGISDGRNAKVQRAGTTRAKNDILGSQIVSNMVCNSLTGLKIAVNNKKC